jgi:hypothetical protein
MDRAICSKLTISKREMKPSMVVHSCNLSTQDADAEGCGVGGSPGYKVRSWLKKKKRRRKLISK